MKVVKSRKSADVVFIEFSNNALLYGVRDQSSFLNCSTLRPASRAMPPIVKAFTGLWRGIVTIRTPSDITACLPWRTMRKPTFSKALTASR